MNKGKILAALLVAFASSTAIAANTTSNFQATATLTASCAITATVVNFGAITPASTGTISATGEIAATCSKALPYNIVISAGSSGTEDQRTMKGLNSDNNDKLNYNLYADSYGENIWGSTPAHGVTVIGNGYITRVSVYGKMKLNQYLKPDTYSDSLTVTLNY